MGKASRKQKRPATRPAPSPSKPQHRASRPSIGRRVLVIAPLLVVAAGVLAYANSFSIPFLLDDYVEISRNPVVTHLGGPLAYLSRPRGMALLSFALNYQVGGFDVWGFHLVNLLVHLANGLLVYLLVLGTLRLPFFRDRYRTSSPVLALLVALVFVVHPLQTGAVSYIVQRTESLAAFFYLATVVLFLHAATAGSRGRQTALYSGAVLTAFLGMWTKQTVVTVPAILLLYSVCFLPGAAPRARWRRWVFGALLLLPVAYAFALSWQYLFPAAAPPADTPHSWMRAPTAGFGVEGMSPWGYLITQFGVVLWYLRLYVLPTRQCFDYGWPVAGSFWQADVVIPMIYLLMIGAAAVASFRRYRLATFCLGWFFLTLAPSSSIIPLKDVAFEHRMYLAVAGLSWLVVVGFYDAMIQWSGAAAATRSRLLRLGAAAAGVWVLLLGVATAQRNHILQSPLLLARDSVEKSPRNWRNQFALADALLNENRPDEAIAALEESIRLDPHHGPPRVTLGSLYLRRGRLDDAEAVLQPATKLAESSVAAAAYLNLGSVYEARGDRDEAAAMFAAAVRLQPRWSSTRARLAELYAKRGDWIDAAGQFNLAIRYNPKLESRLGSRAAEANYRAGVVYDRQQMTYKAIYSLRAAIEYQPNLSLARQHLALIYARARRWKMARAEMDRAAADSPADAAILRNRRRVHVHWLPVLPDDRSQP